jgi:hypothetical protein
LEKKPAEGKEGKEKAGRTVKHKLCVRAKQRGWEKAEKKIKKKLKKRSEEAKSQSQSKPSKRVWAIQAKPYPVIQVHQQQGFIFPFLIN